jgi:hypothetical protein
MEWSMIGLLRKSPVIILLLEATVVLQSAAQDSAKTTVGGFVDIYYASSLQSDPYRTRSYTTQPLRTGEFNLNLGFVEVKHVMGERWSIAGRVEYFYDRYGVLIPTGTPNNFQTVSGSLNVDYAPAANLLWRLEGRVFNAKDPIYPSKAGMENKDGFIGVSAAISI